MFGLINQLTQREKGGRKQQIPERGQALIIIAISFLALLAFVGTVTDIGSLYVTYTQLKRAVDAAAVAAANNIKYPQASIGQRKQRITEAAREMLILHGINDPQSLQVYLCSDQNLPADFRTMCPASGEAPRKLAYVQATQNSPVFFLRLFGVQTIPFTTSAVGEAATVDLVLVFDTSESMASDRCDEAPPGDADPPCTNGYDPRDFDPSTCNANNSCYPLRQAKDAAKTLVNNLFDGYDRVAVVTFDFDAQISLALSTNFGDDDGANDGDVYAAIDHAVLLHNDAPAARLPWTVPSPFGGYRRFNPIFPEDRDGNGADADPGAPCQDMDFDLWDDVTGDPCDDDTILDVYQWGGAPPPVDNYESYSLLSTCTGCGIRVGTSVLKQGGRPTSLWVMVLLSDGVANLSDTPQSDGTIPNQFTYGFCGNNPSTSFWDTYCIDRNSSCSEGRYCIDNDPNECPPGASNTSTSGPYSVGDYACDMVDDAALLYSDNSAEPLGEDIIIYSIGLGAASTGEDLLRYMANVGDDGSRLNDLCASVPALHNCGNYYYAPTGAYLDQIFESIANRIFTKLSR